MKASSQRIWAPIVILIVILFMWEGAVIAFRIEQFLLPRPSVILANLTRVVIVEPETSSVDEGARNQRGVTLLSRLNRPLSGEEEELLAEMSVLYIPWGGGELHLLRGPNLTPILAASWFTLKEALGGLALGVSAGILVALATARWTSTREALLPFAIAANSMPIIAFAPIMNNWFGIDNPFSKMAIVAIMVFFPIMINTVRGLTSVDPRSLELMRSYAAGEAEILFKLRIPNALPFLFSGLKVAGALAMIGAIVGEYFGGPRIALGVFITQEAALFRFASAWAAILLACIMGISIYLVILLLERMAMPWQRTVES